MSYPPFRWTCMQACVKCGCVDTHRVRYGNDLEVVNVAGGTVALEDHLLRTCTRCHYEWKEACLDSE